MSFKDISVVCLFAWRLQTFMRQILSNQDWIRSCFVAFREQFDTACFNFVKTPPLLPAFPCLPTCWITCPALISCTLTSLRARSPLFVFPSLSVCISHHYSPCFPGAFWTLADQFILKALHIHNAANCQSPPPLHRNHKGFFLQMTCMRKNAQ